MDILVLGGGPAGMMAAIAAAGRGLETAIVERNEKLGRKLYISGKGRCNVTNACEVEDVFANIPRNSRFVYSAIRRFTNSDLMAYLEQLGVALKTERGGRVFPVSDKASDITRALEGQLRRMGVQVLYGARVQHIVAPQGKVTGVRLADGRLLEAKGVILCTGGASYPATGSTGDGYRLAGELGHTVVPPRPSLVPLVTKEHWPATLAGVTLKNVALTAMAGEKVLFCQQGEMLFTHSGVSGPLVLSASAMLPDNPVGIRLFINLKPALEPRQLDARLVRELSDGARKHAATILDTLMPHRLAECVAAMLPFSPDMPAHQITRAQRQQMGSLLQAIPMTVAGFGALEEAIVTRGGISIKEVDPSTMQSKKVEGLSFAGEVLDVDGFTGGFNLQIAFSTGRLAGEKCLSYKSLREKG
nr:NAD(P)/FAD-dependent oxidoreductase [bacterium]